MLHPSLPVELKAHLDGSLGVDKLLRGTFEEVREHLPAALPGQRALGLPDVLIITALNSSSKGLFQIGQLFNSRFTVNVSLQDLDEGICHVNDVKLPQLVFVKLIMFFADLTFEKLKRIQLCSLQCIDFPELGLVKDVFQADMAGQKTVEVSVVNVQQAHYATLGHRIALATVELIDLLGESFSHLGKKALIAVDGERSLDVGQHLGTSGSLAPEP